VNIMASRAHRFNGDTPLTDFHGGTAKAALRAVQEAKRRRFEEARAASRALIAHNLSEYERRDRLRPRAGSVFADCGHSHWPTPPDQQLIREPYREPGPRLLPHATLVWDRCGGNCTYCGKPMMRSQNEPMSFSIDHARPRSRGGTHHLDNLVGACRRCNGDKGSLTREEYEAVLAVRRKSAALT
jgi:5-methylcytosine-specific restriction endonuclease McrA